MSATTRPRRVLYFNSWSTAHGGSATSLIDIATRLDRDRYEPLVVCPEPGDLPDRLEARGVPVIVQPVSRFSKSQPWSFLKEIPGFVGLLRRREISLVHGNTASSRRSLLQAAAYSRVPYVQHVRNPVKSLRGQYGFYLANRIVTNSKNVAQPLLEDPALARKTVTIYNAVDLSSYDDRTDHRAAIGAGSRPIVGFVGQIVPRKGVTTLLQAVPLLQQRHPDVLLIIVGCAPPGETDYEAECRRLVATLGLDGHVHWTGYRTDVPAWMRTFDVFALPTRSEPFGKVVIEAMAAGRPVVASRVGGIPEIIEEPGLGTLITPDDPRELAAGIDRYFSDRAAAAATAAAGAASVRKRFGLEEMLQTLQQLYDEVLGRGFSTERPNRST